MKPYADENEIVYECVLCKFKCLKGHLKKVRLKMMKVEPAPLAYVCPMCGGTVIALGSLIKQEKGGDKICEPRS